MARNTPYLPVTRDFAYSADGDTVEPPLSSPPLSSPGTLARFEFEAGKGNEGSKILLVEWPSTSTTSSQASIYWEIMPNGGCLSVDDTSAAASGTARRLYLLPAYSPIPRNVYITTAQETLQTNPLPAIYPARGNDGGRKGVLHTTFARRRLQDLEAEITREARINSESVAVEMALQEKSWIEQEYFVSGSSSHSGSKSKHSKDKGKSKKSSSPKSSSRKDEKKRSEKKKAQVEVYEDEEESESDLFATSMRPRAPDAVMSPYSLRTPDYVPWR